MDGVVANSRMLALDILPLSSSEVLLDPRLDAVLGDGFQELRGCVVLAGLVASAAHVTVSHAGMRPGSRRSSTTSTSKTCLG